MSAVHHFILRGHRAAYPSNESVDDLYWAGITMLSAIALMFIILIIAAFVGLQYKAVGSYQVDGTVFSYGLTTYKHKKVTVWLQQHDGLREYSTGITPSSCRKAPIGTHVPVRVTKMVNDWTNGTRQQVDLVYNPCKEIK